MGLHTRIALYALGSLGDKLFLLLLAERVLSFGVGATVPDKLVAALLDPHRYLRTFVNEHRVYVM
jgi:hypothetical protein